MSPLAIKIIAGLAIFGIAIVGGMIPILVAKQQASRRYLSLGNALAGGIFLGVGFVHLLPEADEALRNLVDYPLAPLLAALGVGLLLLIDRVVLEGRNSMLGQEGERTRPPFYAFVLLIVLSVHSIIAGMALGLQPEAAAALVVMLGILFHKGSAAFALIVTAHSAGNRKLWQTLWLFSVMTPIGIVLGTVAGHVFEGRTALIFEGGFNAIAAGTFIYVAVMDVLDTEMSRERDRIAQYVRSSLMGEDDVPMPEQDRDRWLKIALVVIGIGMMAVMGLWHQHSHLGHSHDDGHDHGQELHEAHDHDAHDEAGHDDHDHEDAGAGDHDEPGHDEDEAGHEDHDDHDHEDHASAVGPPGRRGLLPEAGALAV
ncbi:MAG: ZIP family metal transporter [Acidobacteriota bacterium]|nr:ZIP family metal transporter [Acidobacteriota bacterium]